MIISKVIINNLPFLASLIGFFWSLYLYKFLAKYRWLIIFIQLILSYLLLEIFLSTWISQDPRAVGLDEFVAIPLVYFAYKTFKKNYTVDFILGLILFLGFDSLKPGLIAEAELISGTLGVLADDVLAALLAGIILGLFRFLLKFFKKAGVYKIRS